MSRTKKSEADEIAEKRMVVLDQSRLKPNMPAYQHLKKIAGACGKECISVDRATKRITMSDDICLACLNRCKKCPDPTAIKVVKIPASLSTDTTHHYGQNMFKLHRLPMPAPNQVVGILGSNGTGKSTAVKILSGDIKPNLGRIDGSEPTWQEIIKYYRGSDLQNYFVGVLEDKLRVSLKPQMDADYVKPLKGRVVLDVLQEAAGRPDFRESDPKAEYILKEMELNHLLDRDCGALSGGEVQRLAISRCCLKAADVYIFDEPSSFLDVRQRLAATRLIRSLAHDHVADPSGGVQRRYVLAIEHDLAMLDYMSDVVQCLYGEPGMYGVVTKRTGTRNGINQFLSGYIAAENMRFRKEELSFKLSVNKEEEKALGMGMTENISEQDKKLTLFGEVDYPDMTKVLKSEISSSTFTLHVAASSLRKSEIVGMLGENGTGKTTYMEILGGFHDKKKADAEEATDFDSEPISLLGLGCSIAYKLQNYAPKYRRYTGTVKQLLERNITAAFFDTMFKMLVLRPLGMEELLEYPVNCLSGGELQRLAIVVCLGTPATVYLFDEPSAGLDCEQRVKVSKVLRRWVKDHLQRTAFLIEHDAVMATACADRVVLFTGTPGVEAWASPAMSLSEGFNSFLKGLKVTFRRDPVNHRPRLNKPDSVKDRDQRGSGNFYCFDEDDDDDE